MSPRVAVLIASGTLNLVLLFAVAFLLDRLDAVGRRVRR